MRITGAPIVRTCAWRAAAVLSLGTMAGLSLGLRAPGQARTVIAVGTLLDGRGGVLHDTRIVIDGSRIVSIDPTAAPVTIDLRNRTVMPGWIDTHVHISWHFNAQGWSVSGGDPPQEAARYTAANADATIDAGFTTVQSLGAPIDGAVRDAIAKGEIPGPRILTSLRQITGGSADSIRRLVEQTRVDGADVIKVIATAGLGGDRYQALNDAQLDAACGQAKAAGLRAVVHAVYDEGARRAVRAGCTSIEHGTFIADATLKLMAERGTWFDPSLLVWHNYVERRDAFVLSGVSVRAIRGAISPQADALRRARRLGVRIVFGTDAVAGAHGRNAEEFIYRVREAHEQPADVLMSATSLAAESLGLGALVGRIAPGYEADLVATDGNLLGDITAVRRVVFVMKGGRVVRP